MEMEMELYGMSVLKSMSVVVQLAVGASSSPDHGPSDFYYFLSSIR